MRLIYDTESTGLDRRDLPADHPSQPSICQIGLQLFTPTWERVGLFSALIKPDGWSMEPEAEKHHGISEARCARYGIPIAVALGVLQSYAAVARQIVAHNNEFDRKLIRGELARLKASGLWWQSRASAFVCTMEILTPVMKLPGPFGDFKFPSLEEAHHFLFPTVDYVTQHSAEADTTALARICRELDSRGLFPEMPSLRREAQ